MTLVRDTGTRAAVVILGMHRSGTSCLTGSLQDKGLYLGQVSQRGTFNKKGNRERWRHRAVERGDPGRERWTMGQAAGIHYLE